MAENKSSVKHAGKITEKLYVENGLRKITQCLPECHIEFLTIREFTRNCLCPGK